MPEARLILLFDRQTAVPGLCGSFLAEYNWTASKMNALTYLSLGSNVGDREGHLREAIQRLESAGSVVAVSSLYETEPVDLIDQAWFINCALALETTQTPERLLAVLLEIEQQMGRCRTQQKGPRSIDIDILLFGDA